MLASGLHISLIICKAVFGHLQPASPILQHFYNIFTQFILLTLSSHAFILAVLPPALPPSGCVLVHVSIYETLH